METAFLTPRVEKLEHKTDRIETALLELINVQKRTERNLFLLQQEMLNFKVEMKDFKDEMLAFKNEMKDFKDGVLVFKNEMKDFKDGVLVFKNEMKDFKDEMLEFKNEMKDFKDDTQDFKDEMRVFKKEINKKWAELAQRLGTIAEDIFAPGMPYLAKRLGWEVEKRMLDVSYKKAGKSRQYDAILLLKDRDQQTRILVAEVKSKVRIDDFEQLKKALEELLFFEPEFKAEQIIPVLAGFTIPESVVSTASQRKVLLVQMGGDYLEALNPEVLQG